MAGLLSAGLTSGAGAYVLAPTVVPVLTALLVFAAVAGSPVPWLEWAPLTYIGRRSYGLYLWHSFIMAALLPRWGVPWFLAVVSALALSFTVTEVSWRYVEKPFLRIKERASDASPRRVGTSGDWGRSERVATASAVARPSDKAQ
jgi:peptidoglycan/LPS O-acetylase OafA/YrhL